MDVHKALRQLTAVSIFTVLALGTSYLFKIFLAKELSVSDYGRFFALYSLFALLMTFMDTGLSQAAQRSIIRSKQHASKVKSILIYVFMFQTLMSIALLAMLLGANHIFHILDPDSTSLVILLGLWFITLPISNFYSNIFVGFHRQGLNASMEFVRQVVLIAIAALFFIFNLGIRSPVIAYILMNILTALIYLPLIRKVFPPFYKARAVWRKELLLGLFKYGGLVAITGLLWLAINQLDSIILAYFKGFEAVGFYQAALPLSSIIVYIGSMLTAVSFPLFSDFAIRKRTQQLNDGISLIYRYIFLVSIPVAIALISFPEYILAISFGNAYLPAKDALIVLTVSALLSIICLVNISILNALEKSRDAIWILAIGIAIKIIADLLIIPKYSIIGAAIATVVAAAFIATYSTIRVLSLVDIRFPAWHVTKIFLNGLAVTALMYYLKQVIIINWQLELLIIGTIGALAYIVLSIALRTLDIEEVRGFALGIVRKGR